MTDNLSQDVAALLQVRGWHIVDKNSRGADMWALQGRSEMYLPSVVTRGSFEWSDVTQRIAEAHGERVSSTERALHFIRFDITRFRVDNDARGAQSIPLEAGATVINSAFGMLRAAATSARRPRQSIGSNYSKLGDEIAKEARLGHTETGSFVFPVLLKVSDPKKDSQHTLPDVSFESVFPESEERRVTRTLAQAMAAFEKHVIQPAREPRASDLLPVIIAGGTKEMFSQVSRAISEPGVSWLETNFTWAPTEAAAAEIPRAVKIPADSDSREIISRSVRLLSSPKNEPLRVITGPIIHISHAPGDSLGEIGIQTPSPTGSRLGRVEVTVRAEQLSEIHHWMDQNTTVVVHGIIERRPGRPARLKDVARPRTLDETVLDMDVR